MLQHQYIFREIKWQPVGMLPALSGRSNPDAIRLEQTYKITKRSQNQTIESKENDNVKQNQNKIQNYLPIHLWSY